MSPSSNADGRDESRPYAGQMRTMRCSVLAQAGLADAILDRSAAPARAWI